MVKHSVTEQSLTSGAKGLLVHVPGAPVYNIIIRFNSGFQFGDPSHYELPHVLEHLMACGSSGYPKPNAFKIEVAKNGAYRNASTNARANGYVIECAAFELSRMLDLLEEYIARPIFPAEALPTELSNVREELSRNVTDHDRSVVMALAAAASPRNHQLYETRIEQLPTITLDDVKNYYHTTHTAKNARFYVAGELDEAIQSTVLERLEGIFAALPAGERFEYRDEPDKNVPHTIVVPRDIGQLYYICSLSGGGVDDQGDRALKLLRILLFGGYASRVYGEARRRGLAYHISGGVDSSLTASSIGFNGNVSWDHANDLFELTVNQLLAMRDSGPTEAEVQAGIDMILGSMDRAHQTSGSVLGYYLGRYDFEERVVPLAEEQAAIRALTARDVQQAAAILKPGAAHGLALLGQVKDGDRDQLEKITNQLWN